MQQCQVPQACSRYMLRPSPAAVPEHSTGLCYSNAPDFNCCCCYRTLDPDWGEEFYLEWSEVAAGKRQVLVEVWDWDFWRPDELLGRGFVDINALAFEPLEVCMQHMAISPWRPLAAVNMTCYTQQGSTPSDGSL